MAVFFVTIIMIASTILIAYIILSSKPEEPVKEKSDEEVLAEARHLIQLVKAKEQAEAAGDEKTVQQTLNMTYEGPLPLEKPDGTYTSIYSTIESYDIAGINFRPGIDKYVGDFMGYLDPEPTNKYDPNAIAIYHQYGHHLGYIPAVSTDELRSHFDKFPVHCWGSIERRIDTTENRPFFIGEIFIELPPKVSPSK